MKSKHKTAFLIDSKGNRWKWNCGWWHVNTKGKAQNQTRALGHLEFKRNIKLLDPEDPKQREVLHGMDRPNRHWRRMTARELYVHDLFGNVYLLASDGCHAVVETMLGEREYVCFENLTEYTGIALPKRGAAAKESTAKAKRQSQVLELVNKYMALKA